jgi:hypothetical protein
MAKFSTPEHSKHWKIRRFQFSTPSPGILEIC